MSINRYLPASGTAGFDRNCVRGKRRVPRPPPNTSVVTFLMRLEQSDSRCNAAQRRESCSLDSSITARVQAGNPLPSHLESRTTTSLREGQLRSLSRVRRSIVVSRHGLGRPCDAVNQDFARAAVQCFANPTRRYPKPQRSVRHDPSLPDS